jgi:glycosyltransferase involved in cell wall biosynthesis
VVAAYREVGRAGDVVRGLLPRVSEVVAVDDGSPDAIGAAAEAAGVRVVRRPLNRAQGAALATGLAHALARGADVVIPFDADGRHDPEDLPALVALVAPLRRDDADVVLGSRFLDDRSNPPPLRRAAAKDLPA